MSHYTPGGYGFNWYSSTSQTTEDWEIVDGIRADNHPVGAIVAAGTHGVDVIGYNDLNDPFAQKAQQLNGLYIIDPLYQLYRDTGLPNWPLYGFQPNSYVTIANWNSLYFTSTGSHWNYQYVTVLRSATDAAPVALNAAKPQTYGDYAYSQLYWNHYSSAAAGATVAAASSQGALAAPTVSASVSEAVAQGLVDNGLGKGGALGVDLTGYTIGKTAHVDSLAQQLPSYDLVEIDVAHQVRAVAMVTEGTSGFTFGGITPWTGSFNLASPSAISSAMASEGMAGPGHLVFAWTDQASSPWVPMIEGKDAHTSAPAFLAATGRNDQFSLVLGETPSGK
jgi:hypothetical protein